MAKRVFRRILTHGMRDAIMPRWITRKSVDGAVVEPPTRCYDPASIAAIPGVRTIEECVRFLLEDDESIEGGLDQPTIAIKRGEALVGYIEVSRMHPQERGIQPRL
jgi:hypothetical protein